MSGNPHPIQGKFLWEMRILHPIVKPNFIFSVQAIEAKSGKKNIKIQREHVKKQKVYEHYIMASSR